MIELANVTKAIIKQGITHDERVKNRQWEEIREVVQKRDVIFKGDSGNTMVFALKSQSDKDVEIMKNAKFVTVYLWTGLDERNYEVLERTSTQTLSATLKEIENKLKKIDPKAKILTNEILLDTEKLENEIKEGRWDKLKELIMKSKLGIKDINNALITIQRKKSTGEIRIMPNTSSDGKFVRIEHQEDGEILKETTAGTLFDALTYIRDWNL